MKQINVLIIEDSIYSADLNVRELRKAGFDVYFKRAASKKAMEKALVERRWDVILSDNNMSGFDALQALGVRNRAGCRTPFAIVSEDISGEDVEQAMAEGCYGYIAKEDLDRLGQCVREIIDDSNKEV